MNACSIERPVSRSLGGWTFWRRVLAGAALLVLLVAIWRQSRLADARAALEGHVPDEALESLARIDWPWLPSAEIRLLQARAWRLKGEMQKVRVVLDDARLRGADLDRVKLEQQMALAQAGLLRETEAALKGRLVDAGDDADDICEALVAGFFVHSRFEDAFTLLSVWQADYPDDPEPFFIRGQYYQYIGNDMRAVEEWELALQRAPDRRDIRRRLAEGYLDLRQHDRARAELDGLLQSRPDDADSLLIAGRLHREQGAGSQAEELLRKALSLRPGDAATRLLLARVLSDSGQHDEALAIARDLYGNGNGDRATAAFYLQVLRATGATDEVERLAPVIDARNQIQVAIDELVAELRENPGSVDLRLQLAERLIESQQNSRAIQCLQTILELAPDHPQAKAMLDDLARQSG